MTLQELKTKMQAELRDIEERIEELESEWIMDGQKIIGKLEVEQEATEHFIALLDEVAQ